MERSGIAPDFSPVHSAQLAAFSAVLLLRGVLSLILPAPASARQVKDKLHLTMAAYRTALHRLIISLAEDQALFAT
ncbi:hypothetical protein C0V76_12215 [Uliginosibacterium sp. TH139]|nr:hypothetical protein C0V76_12215 [Uliginosibacterium sp. TH139]